jgi:hypothetical protein
MRLTRQSTASVWVVLVLIGIVVFAVVKLVF